jgi:diguanylate cyclase (GGDEF)-like protein/PAS domain S-box-containing protein
MHVAGLPHPNNGDRPATSGDPVHRRLLIQFAVAEALAECRSMAEAAPRVLRALCECMEWEVGAVWMVDPKSNVLLCADMFRLPSVRIPGFEAESRALTLPKGMGLPGRVWETANPTWVVDVTGDPNFQRARMAAREGLHAAMAFPIRAGRQVLGAIEVFTREARPPDQDMLRMMEAVGSQIGQFLERRSAEMALREIVARQGAILDAALDCIITMDHEGRVVEFNPAAERTFGYLREEIVGQSLAEFIIPARYRARHREALATYLRSGTSSILGKRIELSALRASGSEFPVELTVTRIDLPGPPVFTAYLRDISERKRAEERLRQAETTYRRLVEQIPAVTYIDAPNDISSTIFISPQIEALTGYSPEEWTTDPELWVKLLHPEDRESVLTESARTNATGDPFTSEYRLIARDGRTVWLRDESVLIRDEKGRPQYWQGILLDITERKQAEEEVAFLAYHDRLTGLPNRAMFEEIMQLDLARARRHRLSVAVLYMDLDNFKLINDSLGHEAGDELLRQVAARITEASRETDLVARLGGDEFLILLSDIEHGPGPGAPSTALLAVETVASRLHECLREPFRIEDSEFYVSASIGISVYPIDARDGRTLLKHADAAMYRSKKFGPGSYVVFPAEETDRRTALSMATRLRGAVEARQWMLHYQPVIHLTEGHAVGVEALLRWKDPDEGIIPPAEFISLAEEMGLIERIGDWVLEELCRQSQLWRAQGLELELSFNLSPRQLWQPEVVQKVLAPLRAGGCDPTTVIVEITESAVMTDPDRTQEILEALREHGIRFAIDDFGTGYSALSRLKDLPVDILKIDRSFVRDLPHDQDAGTMARTIIQLAHSLGMIPLAEGIESEEQWRFLVEQGCVYGQGFLFSHPLPGDQITAQRFARASSFS